jgi:hypothetical protein
MKNLPYYKGGTRQKQEFHLSFKGNLKELEFVDFEDFCNRADIILKTYIKYRKEIDRKAYKEYIYSKKFNTTIDDALKDKCYEWILSSEYELISKNDLYSLLGMIKRGKK